MNIKRKIVALLLIVQLGLIVNENNVYAASYSNCDSRFSGWSEDHDLDKNVEYKSFSGSSYTNKSKKPYKKTTDKSKYTANRSITGSLSSTLKSELSVEETGAEGSLAAEITASVSVELAESYEHEISMYPTSEKYGKNYIDPRTKWSTKIIVTGNIISGYAKKWRAWICTKKGTFNIKVPTGFRTSYKYKSI